MQTESVPSALDKIDRINKEADQLISNIGEDLGIFDASESIETPHQIAKTSQDIPEQVESASSLNAEPFQEDSDSITVDSTPSEITEEDPEVAITGPITVEKDIADQPIEQTLKVLPEQADQTIEMRDASSQYDLAVSYYDGKGQMQDDAKAMEWFTKAAEQGHPDAQYKLGVMYSFGQGAAQDAVLAVNWFRKAAEQGMPAAQYCLGVMYGTGQGVPLDPVAAAEWYTRAADQGSVAAQYMLGIVYSKGQGVTRDSDTAIQWYTRAAEQGSPAAQYILGVIYEKGQGVVVPDEEEALKWYMRAAEGGHADAQYDLALNYMTGKAVEKDFVKAYKWCLLAGLNQKNVAKREKWLEERMTADQLEEARRQAREFTERGSQELSSQ
jgi:TPR repeat protein